MGGRDPYSASKGAAELVAAAYRRSFFPAERLAAHGIRVATARAGNVIGGGDWAADRLVPDLARAFLAGRTAVVRNPGSVRPWQHVLEPLSGYVTLAERMLVEPENGTLCSAWNFGPRAGDEWPTARLADRFAGAWSGGARWTDGSDPAAPHEAVELRLSIDKAARGLGWRPRWDTEMAVRRTAAWYRASGQGGFDASAACLADMAAYRNEGKTA